jgi:hypothetical protein
VANNNPVDVTTKEKLAFIVPRSNVPLPVQFEATAYVPGTDSVVITPSWDAVVTEANVAVVESNVIWATLLVGVPVTAVPPCSNP